MGKHRHSSPIVDQAVERRLRQLHSRLVSRYAGRVIAQFGRGLALALFVAQLTFALSSVAFGYEPLRMLDLVPSLGIGEIALCSGVIAVIGTLVAVVAVRRSPAPTMQQAALYCEAMEGSPGSVALAASGIGGPEVAAHAAAALDATLARSMPSAFGRRGAMWVVALILTGVAAGWTESFAASLHERREMSQVALVEAGQMPAGSERMSQSAGAESIGALRDRLLSLDPEARAAAAGRYAERMRDTRMRIEAIGAAAKSRVSDSDADKGSAERGEGTARGVAQDAAAMIAAHAEPGSEGERLLRSYSKIRDEQSALQWLESADSVMRAVGDRARQRENEARSVGRGTAGREGEAGDLFATGSGSAAQGGADPSERGASAGGAIVVDVSRREPRPVVAARWSKAAATGARYLAALESAGGGSVPRSAD